jgi:uncharacterized membrane protein affecting hemolysin expression
MSAMVFLVLMITGTLWLYLSINLSTLLLKQTDTFAQTITQQVASSLAEMVMADDQLAISIMLENLVLSSENIQHISIFNEKNKLIAEAQSAANGAELNSYQTRILFQDVKAGSVRLTLDK